MDANIPTNKNGNESVNPAKVTDAVVVNYNEIPANGKTAFMTGITGWYQCFEFRCDIFFMERA